MSIVTSVHWCILTQCSVCVNDRISFTSALSKRKLKYPSLDRMCVLVLPGIGVTRSHCNKGFFHLER